MKFTIVIIMILSDYGPDGTNEEIKSIVENFLWKLV